MNNKLERTLKKTTRALFEVLSLDTGREIEESHGNKYMFVCHYQNTGQESFVKKTSAGAAVRNHHYIHKKRLPEMLPTGLRIGPS